MPKEQPSYYANIPADVRYDDDLDKFIEERKN